MLLPAYLSTSRHGVWYFRFPIPGALHPEGLAAGRPVETAALVASLRDFIRKALDLDPVPADVTLPAQGPTRPGARAAGAGQRVQGSPGAVWAKAIAKAAWGWELAPAPAATSATG